MPLPLPSLDNRTYADLLEEARSLIPTYAPEWTNHNAADPGITLIELFAWLTEMLIYRTDQIPDRHVLIFLKLLNGPDWQPGINLADDIRTTVIALRQRYQAVTREDYQSIACQASPEVKRAYAVAQRNLDAGNEAARIQHQPGYVSLIIVPSRTTALLCDGTACMSLPVAEVDTSPPVALLSTPSQELYIGAPTPFTRLQLRFEVKGSGYALRYEFFNGTDWTTLQGSTHNLDDRTANWTVDDEVGFTTPSDWHPSLIAEQLRYWLRITTASAPGGVAKAKQILAQGALQPSRALIQRVRDYLEPRRVLTTRLQVVGPTYAPVSVELLIARRADVRENDLRQRVVDALTIFLDPLHGGPQRTGWPFGRDIYLSELYEILESIVGVDYVMDMFLSSTCQPSIPRCISAPEQWHSTGDQIGLALASHHLPYAAINPAHIIISAIFIPLTVTIQIVPETGVALAEINRAVKTTIKRCFHPLYGGPDWSQWQTAEHDVTLATMRTRLQNLSEVARVTTIACATDPARLRSNAQGEMIGVSFEARELVDVRVEISM